MLETSGMHVIAAFYTVLLLENRIDIRDGIHVHVIVNDPLGSMRLTATCTSQSD